MSVASEYLKQWRAQRLADGFCVLCGDPCERKRCFDCLLRHAAYQLRWDHKTRLATGSPRTTRRRTRRQPVRRAVRAEVLEIGEVMHGPQLPPGVLERWADVSIRDIRDQVRRGVRVEPRR